MEANATETPEAIRESTVKILEKRIRLLGIDKSGAYQHYKNALSRGFPIPRYEIAILELIRSRFPDLRSYHEIGSGLGTLPLMLAYDGFAAVGIERDEPRHLTATAIMHDLTAQNPKIENNCRFIGAYFPDGVADIDVSESMAILTDFVSTHEPHEYVSICHGLARYRYVLLDMQRFCRRREVAEYEDLITELGRYGLSPRGESFDVGTQGYYRLFERRSQKEHPKDTGRAFSGVTGEEGAAAMQRTVARSIPDERSVPPLVGETQVGAPLLLPRPRRSRKRRFGGMIALSALLVIGLPTLLGALYYGWWAADQYVTTFEFAVRGPQPESKSGSGSFGSSSAMTPDAFVVADYINSDQAVHDVGKALDLRRMFSKPYWDFFAKFNPQESQDDLDLYWKKMVSAQFDLISGNVTVSVHAFTAEDSFRLANEVITTSQTMFQSINDSAARNFVKLADENLARVETRWKKARTALESFRGTHDMMDPTKTADTNSTILASMRSQLAGLRSEYTAISSATPKAPTLKVLSAEIAALQKQISRENEMRSPETVESVTPGDLDRYENLDVERVASEKLYGDALDLIGKSYLQAESLQSFIALFVKPKLAHESFYPNRAESVVIVFVASLGAWFAGLLIFFAVKDHLA
jgi:capsular polysaccharide transport system permease protein